MPPRNRAKEERKKKKKLTQTSQQDTSFADTHQTRSEPADQSVPRSPILLPSDIHLREENTPISVAVEDPVPPQLDLSVQDTTGADLSEELPDPGVQDDSALKGEIPPLQDAQQEQYCLIIDGEGKCPDHPEATTLLVGTEICCLECGKYWSLPPPQSSAEPSFLKRVRKLVPL